MHANFGDEGRVRRNPVMHTRPGQDACSLLSSAIATSAFGVTTLSLPVGAVTTT